MISWSNTALRFTSGIGALATAGLLADISGKELPAWLVVAVAMVPLVVFLLLQPGEWPAPVVRMAQVAASFWYLVLAVMLTGLFFARGHLVRGWPLYFIFLSVGAVPCLIVLRRSLFEHRARDLPELDQNADTGMDEQDQM